MITLNKEEAAHLLNRINNINKQNVLHVVLSRTLSFVNLLDFYNIVESLKKGECQLTERDHYLIDNDLKNFEDKQKLNTNNITVTVKGFNTFEEANEFCEWYCGQGEQNASIWFEERKIEGIINSSFMESEIIQKTDNSNIDMTLRMIS